MPSAPDHDMWIAISFERRILIASRESFSIEFDDFCTKDDGGPAH